MDDDGTMYLGDDLYSVTFSFSDINYNNTSEKTRVSIFEQYCYFLNSLDESIHLQIHIESKQLLRTNTSIFLTGQSDNKLLNTCINEYNDQMNDRITGSKSYIQNKYLTLTIRATDMNSAKRQFERIDSDSLIELRSLKCTTKRLTSIDRYYLLRDIYRFDDGSEISKSKIASSGIYDKDLIAPYGYDTSNSSIIKFGDFYAKTLFITDLPDELSDEFIRDICSVDDSLFLTMNISPQDPGEAIAEVKKRLRRLDKEEYDSQLRQAKMNVAYPKTPRDLQRAIDTSEDLYSDLQTRNEKMFIVNFLITINARKEHEINDIVSKIESKINKTGCRIKPFSFSHENAFNSSLPLGRDDIFVKRMLTTSSVAVFSPFNVVELLQDGGFSYGKNTLSNNLLIINRKRLTNPHGFIFGTSGSGKSMGVKAEIWECFWRTNDDIILIDPDGEFTKLVEALGGQVIDISATSNTYFNPFDINENYGGEDEPNPIPFKSNFIISLIEVTLNYHDGIEPITRSIIDRCVREIYKPYQKTKDTLDVPTFLEFFNELKKQPESEATYLASALEIYVEGTLNIFSQRTNIKLNNRLVCFNTKKLGKQLKVMGMTIVQDFSWNIVSKNQSANKNTWLWNDEIHHSLKNPITCEWLVQSWKRGRKYGLIATGITQEVKDCCMNDEARALIANSEFVILYKQKEEMLDDLARITHLSDAQQLKLLAFEKGSGYLKAGNSLVEFNNHYNEDTSLFEIMQTNIGNKGVSNDENVDEIRVG